MGWFSFWTKRPPAGVPNGSQLHTQAYDSTAVALPPIRGSLPVQGNGPTTLVELKRAAKKRSEAQHSESPAPPPAVPRLRSKSLARPSTATSEASSAAGPQRPKSSGRSRSGSRPSFPFLLNKSSGPPYLLGVSGPDDKHNATLAPPVPALPAHFKDAQTSGSGSITSGRSAGYIDLLDAQGDLKPSDFRARVKAAGARDYGEDVADRNIGINGVDLNSPAVRAFYALSGGAALAYKTDGSAIDVHGNQFAANALPAHLLNAASQDVEDTRIRSPHSTSRTTSRRSLKGTPAGQTRRKGRIAAIEDNDNHESGSLTANRPKSLYESERPSTATKPRPRPLSMHPVIPSNFAERSAPVAEIPRVPPRSRQTSAEPSSARSSNGKARDATAVKQKKHAEKRPKSRGEQSIRSVSSWQRNYLLDTESEGFETSKSRHSASTQRQGRSLAAFQSEEDYSDARVPMENLMPSLPLPRTIDLLSHQGNSRPQSQRSYTSSALDQTRGESSRTPVRPSTSSGPHPRNRSFGGLSASGRSYLDDISEHVPKRRSSLTQGSIASITPTVTSSKHSNGYEKSHVRHTPDTSIDLGFQMPRKKTGHPKGKNSVGTINSLQALNAQRVVPHKMTAYHDQGADDYITATTDGSDAELYVGQPQPRRRDGEGLLFRNEGYGHFGTGLPGLFDNGASALPMWASMPSETLEPQKVSESRSNDSAKGFSEPSRPVCPPWEQEDSDTVSESDFAATTPRRIAPPPLFSAQQPREYRGFSGSSQYDPIEEETDEKPDVKLAVQLRKEMKRKERLAASPKTVARSAFVNERARG